MDLSQIWHWKGNLGFMNIICGFGGGTFAGCLLSKVISKSAQGWKRCGREEFWELAKG